MKNFKFIFVLLFAGFTFCLYPQSAREQKLLDKLCKQSCDDINKTDFSEKDNLAETQTKLGMALLPTLTENSKEIKAVWGLDMNNADDGRKVGEKLGAALVFKCEKFQSVVMRISEGGKLQTMEEVKEANSGSSSSLAEEGNIDKIECTDVCVIYFKTTDGETLKIFWWEKVSGSSNLEQFTDADKNKKFKIKYSTSVVYQPKSKSYQTIKVLKSIE